MSSSHPTRNGRTPASAGTPTSSVVVNGIDLDAVARVRERYRADPTSGRTAFDAHVQWRGGYRTEGRLGAYGGLPGDEPVELAGSGSGPAPEELLLAAAAQCLLVGIAGTATARGLAVRALSVHAAGEVDLAAAYGVSGGHPGFQEVRLTVHLSADADRATLEEIVQQALASAPIPDTVARAVPVTARLA